MALRSLNNLDLPNTYVPTSGKSTGRPQKKWKDQFLEEGWGVQD
jgi:hypothetical protein